MGGPQRVKRRNNIRAVNFRAELTAGGLEQPGRRRSCGDARVHGFAGTSFWSDRKRGQRIMKWSRLAIRCAGIVVIGFSAINLTCAEEPAWKTVFEQADFLFSDERRPPGESAAWQPVSLPDQWRHRMPDGIRGQAWYRIKFDLTQSPSSVHAVGITHPRAFRTDFFVNGKLVGGAGDLIAGGRGPTRGSLYAPVPSFMTALHVMVAPQLLDAGENTIHVRVNATSSGAFLHGLPRVSFGEARALHKENHVSSEMGLNAQRMFFTMALVTGIITLFLWLALRSDRVLFWYSVACLTWSLVSIPRLALRWMDSFQPLIPVLSWFLNYGLVVPVVILCLRTVNLKWRRFEAALWAYLAIEAAFPLWATDSSGQGYLAWDTANSALLLAGVAVIVFRAKRPLRWSVILQIAALLLMAALMFFEVMRYLGWVYVDFKAVRHYHVPLMLLAIGAMIFERHVLAVQRTERSNLQLKERVAEKAREIEANYARVEEVRRERALAQERQRILTDMHDGLGASLIGILRHAHSGGSDCAGIERRVQEALQEMKIAVDALKPAEGDIAAVLGSLRYRLDSMIRETGIRLMWKVAELPPVSGLSPSTVFALQRILLEAITNVLKHSGATQISFTARAQGKDEIRIKVEDDGKGFDPLHPRPGLGLANMRNRAARIGVVLEIRSRPSEGTLVELALPTSLAGAAATSASAEPEPNTPQRAKVAAGFAS